MLDENNPNFIMFPKRVLLKISGEFLGNSRVALDDSDGSFGSDSGFLDWSNCLKMLEQLQELLVMGIEVVLVVGGGNLVRGRDPQLARLSGPARDEMGMLGTCINGVALQEGLEQLSIASLLTTARPIEGIGEVFCQRKARQALEEKKIVICAGGLGIPFFTTDTASVVRARQLGCQKLFKGTSVQGVFTQDPHTHPQATFLPQLTYQECIDGKLAIMDQTAFILAQQENLPLVVFDLYRPRSIVEVVLGRLPSTHIR
jgi:uridylate kinase